MNGCHRNLETNHMEHELALVMPVYNEEECIYDVVCSWLDIFLRLKIDFLIIILNDGSTDGTKAALSRFSSNDRINIVNKENSGHGSTILMGYRQAVKHAKWVFQCDSDDEMKPENFHTLWEKREEFDALFGIRESRSQKVCRKFISAVSRFTIRLLFGGSVTDVNTPYRLIRSDVLKKIVVQMPQNLFAPNIVISGLLARKKTRIYNYPVPHHGRKTGTVSIRRWKLCKAAVTALFQTIYCSFVIKVEGDSDSVQLAKRDED